MNSEKYIFKPGDTPDASLMGGKANALARLADSPLGGRIPAWFVLGSNAFVQNEKNSSGPSLLPGAARALKKELAALASDGATLFAVRSSAVGEDGASASFAGQLKTELQVSAQDVPMAVERVRESAGAANVALYRSKSKETAPLATAVLVQLMTPADVAGVVFSNDPVSGDAKRMVISACAGLGEQLVSGQVDGETYFCARDGALLEGGTYEDPLLGAKALKTLCAMAAELEAFFGTPQDVEWAMAGGKLYLLQSRPITTLQKPAAEAPLEKTRDGSDVDTLSGMRLVLWDNSNIVESYSGVTMPLTFSFARYIYEHVYIEFCRFMGVGKKRIAEHRDLFRNMLGSINGHVYYNLLRWYEWLTLFPGFALNRRFMEQMMGVGEELPEEFLKDILPGRSGLLCKAADAVRLARSGFGLLINNVLLKRKMRAFNKRLDSALATTPEALAAMPLDRLALEYRTLESRLLRAWDAPLINDFLCMMAFGLSRKLLHKYGGEAGDAYHRDMLIGQGDIISAEPARLIREMAFVAAKDASLVAVLQSGDKARCAKALSGHPELAAKIEAYLAKFGDRCLQELKLESPTIADEPGTLYSSIGFLAARVDSHADAARGTLPELSTVIGTGRLKNRLVGRIAVWAKELVRNRENLRFERTRLFGQVRRIFVHMGTRLTALGLLDAPRDVFYLQVEEVLGLVEGTSVTRDLKGLVSLRKLEYAGYIARPEPPSRLVTRGAAAVALESLMEESTLAANNEKKESLTGIGCCRGTVTGRVRVILDPRNATLDAGEIMVARFTDPGWIMLFANAAGILVERGSLLSHSAIVARELNIPAIVGLKGVTSWLQTGDMVVMDGGSGIVTRKDSAA